MNERPGPPEPLGSELEDLLAEFRDAEGLPGPARERIWNTVSADEPPRRRFVAAPSTSAQPGRRWAIVAVAAVAAVTVLWLGLGDRLTADQARPDERRGAAAMVERGDDDPRTAVERQVADSVPSERETSKTAATPESPTIPETPAPLEPEVAADDAGAPHAEATTSVEPKPTPSRSDQRPAPNRVQPSPSRDPEPEPSAPPSPSTLSEEQRLVGKAWSALTEGNPEGAMSVVRDHAKRFPQGILAPERDAVSAIARCRISPDASSSILAAFRRAHASSPLASRVSKACAPAEKKSSTP